MRALLLAAMCSGLVCSILAQTTSQEVCRGTQRCYHCDSKLGNDDCHDPFFPVFKSSNGTKARHPPKHWLSKCEGGCCVKQIWTSINNTRHVLRTKRGCSSNADWYSIENQLLAHVCISEHQGKGMLCMCEGERCNDAISSRILSLPITILLPVLTLIT